MAQQSDHEWKAFPADHDDLTMMRSPERWPCGAILPMKRYTPTFDTAVLAFDGLGYWFIPGVTMFESVKIDDPRVQKDPDFSAILADGWVVD